jgi:DDE superfamily endonuclease/Homeodomain-like domain
VCPDAAGWRGRSLARGVAGLDDEPRSSRPWTIDHAAIITATLRPPPKQYGVTHWSTRLLARHLDISDATVAKAWREYLVMDNYAAHKHPNVKKWLGDNPRVVVHFTPTHASWMNLVEVWFSLIERQAIHRGTLPVRPRPQRQDPRVHRRLERPRTPVRLDQNC